ncbi:MAG: tetraacyldisaccharide 4'-kinase [Rhizobiales bacterium]|nr:tetraacyldisaccharide 4'-kinase [Hyphomicrobiales bacterium]
MRDPAFWWRPPGALALSLAPVGAVYGLVAAMRLRQRGHTIRIPVVCVGNFTLGGTGKTPAAMSIARLLAANGIKPFFLSRGYGGRLAGPLRVDTTMHRATDVGDEPLLLDQIAPTIVSRNRAAGASAALAGGADIIVMDDGLQNPSLVKDYTIAVIDGRRGIGNGFVFPAGPLRAPLAAQFDKTDALLVIGGNSGATDLVELAHARGLPVFTGRLVPIPAELARLSGRKVLAFAGIGNPEKFFATLRDAGIDAPVREAFADHHRYTATEAADLLARAARDNLLPVTTEKDMARLAGEPALKELASRACALPVALALDNEIAFRKLLFKKIGKA